MSRKNTVSAVCLFALTLTTCGWGITNSPEPQAAAVILSKLNDLSGADSGDAADRKVAERIIRAICSGNLNQLQSVIDHSKANELEMGLKLASYAMRSSNSGFEIFRHLSDNGEATCGLILFPSLQSLVAEDLMLTLQADEPAAIHSCVLLRATPNAKSFDWKPYTGKDASAVLDSIGKEIADNLNVK